MADSFGTSQSFIEQQQQKRQAKEAASVGTVPSAPAPQSPVTPVQTPTETLGQKNARQQAEFAAKQAANNTAPNLQINTPAAVASRATPATQPDYSFMAPSATTPSVAPSATTSAAPSTTAAPAVTPTLAQTSTAQGEQAKAAVEQNRTAVDQQQVATESAKVGQEQNKNAQISAATQYQQEQEAINNAKISNLQAQQAEYEQLKQAQTDKAVATVQPLIDQERASNTAAQNKAQADYDLAKAQAEEQVKVDTINNGIAFAKLGLSLSPAAMNTTMNIANQSALKIAQLTANFGVSMAGLKKDAAKIEVDHQLAMNKIIDDNALDVFNYKATTKDKILAVQSDISLSRKEKADAISKIQTEYHNNILKLSDKLVADTRANNDYVDRQLSTVHDMLKQKQDEGKAEAIRLIQSGRWNTMNPAQKQQVAIDAGMTLSEVEGQKTSSTYAAINTAMDSIMPGVFVSPESSKKVFDYASSLMAMGTPATQAVSQAIKANLGEIPEYKKFKATQEEEQALKIEKAKTDIALERAKITEALRPPRSGVGGGGSSVPKVDYKAVTNQIMSAAGYNPSSISFTGGQSTNINEIKELVEAKAKTEGVQAALNYAASAMKEGGYAPDIKLGTLPGTIDAAQAVMQNIEGSKFYGSPSGSIEALKKAGAVNGEDNAQDGQYYYETKEDDKGNVTRVDVYKKDGLFNDTDVWSFK